MKKKKLYAVTTLLFVVGSCFVYYFYPRSVHFELAKEIEKPNPEFDRSYFVGFEYIENKESLFFYMVYRYEEPPFRDMKGYDTVFVKTLSKDLDFDRYDYIIAYQKKLKKLRYSPYLTKTEDDLYFEERTPLIPIWDSVRTDKVYIYRIKKNNKFRSYGP